MEQPIVGLPQHAHHHYEMTGMTKMLSSLYVCIFRHLLLWTFAHGAATSAAGNSSKRGNGTRSTSTKITDSITTGSSVKYPAEGKPPRARRRFQIPHSYELYSLWCNCPPSLTALLHLHLFESEQENRLITSQNLCTPVSSSLSMLDTSIVTVN